MNSPFLARYDVDQSAPSAKEALRDVAVRVLGPVLLLFGFIVGLGFLLMGVFNEVPAEDQLVTGVQEGRTATWDSVSKAWSMIGNTEYIIATCAVVSLLILWRTRQWWFAVVPAIAISMQASVFVIAAWIVGRPRPEADQLDPAPPTSSYPSGHVGAATALYLSFALMAQRIENAFVRRVVTAICLVVPVLVAYARFYRGMHHPTDILVAVLNGVVCSLLAWHWVRRRNARRSAEELRADAARQA